LVQILSSDLQTQGRRHLPLLHTKHCTAIASFFYWKQHELSRSKCTSTM